MPKSKITSTKEYTKELWVISVLNSVHGSPGLIDGHSAIVVEGIEEDGKPFIGQYDVAANAAEEEKGSLNPKGLITKIKCFENENNKRNYEKEKYFSGSVYATPIEAKRMIASIKADEEQVKKGMENLGKKERGEPLHLDEQKNPIQPLSYQRLGKDHFLVKLLGKPEAGDNCAGWCVTKLAIAGIDIKTLIPKPKVLPTKMKCHAFFSNRYVQIIGGATTVALIAAGIAYKA